MKLIFLILFSTTSFFSVNQTQSGLSETSQSTEINSNTTSTNNSNMQLQQPQPGETIATIKTNKGDIKIKLFTEKVPQISKNFIELSKQGKYEDVVFHRIIEDFMVQTGDFETGRGFGGHSYKGPGTKLEDEFHPDLTHLPYAVSMANAGPNTNGSQFFIVTADQGTPFLDNKHSVFAQVYDGREIVDMIEATETDANDYPLEEPKIVEVIIEEL